MDLEDRIDAVEREIAPKLAALSDQITQNEKLFARIAAVYEKRESSGLTPEQQRLVWLDYTNFMRAGAKLDAPSKKRLSEINQRLASLFTEFSQNVLADETDYVLVLEKESDLAGLPPSLRAAASAAAESRGHKGKWAVLNTRSSMEPFLTYSDRRDLREKVWRTYYSRGDNGDKHDNNKGITEILMLRGERAKSFSFWVIWSERAASFGAISRSTACTSGVLSVPAWISKIVLTRSSVRPAPSRAAIVLAKVAGSGLPAIRSTSASCSAIAASRAGWNCSAFAAANGGTPP